MTNESRYNASGPMQRNGTVGVSWQEKLVVARNAVEASAGRASHSNRRVQVGPPVSIASPLPPRRRRAARALRFTADSAAATGSAGVPAPPPVGLALIATIPPTPHSPA